MGATVSSDRFVCRKQMTMQTPYLKKKTLHWQSIKNQLFLKKTGRELLSHMDRFDGHFSSPATW